MKRCLSSFVLFVSLSSVYGRCCSSVVKSETKEAIIVKFNRDVNKFMNELTKRVNYIVANPVEYECDYVFEGEVNIANVTPYIIDREYISNSFSVDAKAKVVDNARKLNEKKLQDGIKSLKKVKDLENFFEDLNIKCFLLMKKKTYFLRNGDSLILPAFCLIKISQEDLEEDKEKLFFFDLIENDIVDVVYKIDKSSIEKKYSLSDLSSKLWREHKDYLSMLSTKEEEESKLSSSCYTDGKGYKEEDNCKSVNKNNYENYAQCKNYMNYGNNTGNNTGYNTGNNTGYNKNYNKNYNNNNQVYTKKQVNIREKIYKEIVFRLYREDEVMQKVIMNMDVKNKKILPDTGVCIKFLDEKKAVYTCNEKGNIVKYYGDYFEYLYSGLLSLGSDIHSIIDKLKGNLYEFDTEKGECYNFDFFSGFIEDIVLFIGLIQYKNNNLNDVYSFFNYFSSAYDDYLRFLYERGPFKNSVPQILNSFRDIIQQNSVDEL